MNFKYFESEEGLEKLLIDYKNVMDMIDDYGQQLVQGVLSTSEEYKQCLDSLTGAFLSLEPLYTMAEATKLNNELEKYVELKRDLESRGEKIVATSLEKESSLSVANFRRIRAILEGYVEASAKGIATCQTQLKMLQSEIKGRLNDNQS